MLCQEEPHPFQILLIYWIRNNFLIFWLFYFVHALLIIFMPRGLVII